MLERSTCLLVILLAVSTSSAQKGAVDDAGLRVLFVGHDPEAPRVAFPQMAEERTWALHRERTGAFEALLRYHFRHVTIVYGADYTVDMSDGVDVTIFDTRPKALTERVDEVDPETGERVYEAATYLPQSFDRPALMTAENSPLIGEPLGSKLDWL